jgi:hypothetical protein
VLDVPEADPATAPGTGSRRIPVDRALLRYRVRRAIDRMDDPVVREARRLVERFRSDPPDVLVFGDSSSSFIAPADADRRRLPDMIADGLGPQVSMYAAHRGGFHPEVFYELVRLVGSPAKPPVVVIPICVRLRQLPWVEHPMYGYQAPLRRLRAMEPSTPTRRIHAAIPHPTKEDFARVASYSYPTVAGDLTIGEYVEPLKHPAEHGLSRDERIRLLYAYHHGARLHVDLPSVQTVTRLGELVRSLQWPAVVYETPIPIERGTAEWGDELATIAADNLRLTRRACRDGFGPDTTILETGTAFDDSEILDPDDACEHLNERGRQRLAATIAGAVEGAHARAAR